MSDFKFADGLRVISIWLQIWLLLMDDSLGNNGQDHNHAAPMISFNHVRPHLLLNLWFSRHDLHAAKAWVVLCWLAIQHSTRFRGQG
jgi:hypothetical protein